MARDPLTSEESGSSLVLRRQRDPALVFLFPCAFISSNTVPQHTALPHYCLRKLLASLLKNRAFFKLSICRCVTQIYPNVPRMEFCEL